MEIEDYEAWLNHAQPGDTLVYWVGELARDRGHYGPKMEWIPAPLDALARLIYRDAELGLVELTQRAGTQRWIGPIRCPRWFEYRATRASKEM